MPTDDVDPTALHRDLPPPGPVEGDLAGLSEGVPTSLDAAPGKPASLAARLSRSLPFVAGGAVFALFLLMAGLAPALAPFDPAAVGTGGSLEGPSWSHLMGTDSFGRDVFSRVVHGSRLSLLVGFASVVLSATVGTAMGVAAGWCRGRIDAWLMRANDVLLAFPGLMLALAVAAVLGTGTRSIILAVGVSGIPSFARVVRGAVLEVRERDFLLAARATGCRGSRIVRVHVLPNIAGPVIVMTTLYLAFAVLVASSLSFLGVGVQPPTPEWGAMTSAGRDVLVTGWWVSTFPGLMIVLFVLSVNVMGDAVRDALDVKVVRN